MPETTGKKTPGGDGERWNTPAQTAAAVARLGRWRGDRPAPLKRIDLPTNNGTQRPLSSPTLADRARHAVLRHARPPMAETTGEQPSDGVRPTRRGAAAIDHGVKGLRQHSSATGIVAGEIPGCFATSRLAGRAAPLPRHQGVLSTWLRRGYIDRGTRLAPTAGGPPGGRISPVVSHLVVEGRAAVVHGGRGHRRVHHLNDGRWADDGIVTATSRQVVEETGLPRMHAVLAARGVRLSPTTPVITPSTPGVDC